MPPLTEQQKAYQREYYIKNRVERLARTQEWRDKNPDKVKEGLNRYWAEHKVSLNEKRLVSNHVDLEAKRARDREYYRSYKHRVTLRQKRDRGLANVAWRLRNVDRTRELGRLNQAIRNSRRYSAGGSFSLEQWYSRCEMYSWKCAYCEIPLSHSSVTIDHVIPISRGGPNWPSNLAPACRKCNSSKRDSLWLPLRLVKKERLI